MCVYMGVGGWMYGSVFVWVNRWLCVCVGRCVEMGRWLVWCVCRGCLCQGEIFGRGCKC